MTQVTCLMRYAPYGTDQARESLDALLAMAIFTENLSVVWLDDGVFQITQSHQSDKINRKNFNLAVKGFDLYGVDQRYVCETSLKKRGIRVDDLSVSASPLDSPALNQLLARSDKILSL